MIDQTHYREAVLDTAKQADISVIGLDWLPIKGGQQHNVEIRPSPKRLAPR